MFRDRPLVANVNRRGPGCSLISRDILEHDSDRLANMERPQTRYVDVGRAEVAYQVVGQGPPDLVYVPTFGHVDVRWDNPVFAAFLERLAYSPTRVPD